MLLREAYVVGYWELRPKGRFITALIQCISGGRGWFGRQCSRGRILACVSKLCPMKLLDISVNEQKNQMSLCIWAQSVKCYCQGTGKRPCRVKMTQLSQHTWQPSGLYNCKPLQIGAGCSYTVQITYSGWGHFRYRPFNNDTLKHQTVIHYIPCGFM